jgi:predicted phosphodiesterase
MTDKAADTAALLWQPPGPSTACIEYWRVGAEKSEGSPATCMPKGEVQRMVLSGLRPDTPYAYRVYSIEEETDDEGASKEKASGKDKGKVYEFRTGSGLGEARTFAVMGDSHGNQEVLHELLTQTIEETPSLDFLLHVGDAVDDGSVAGSWHTDFIDPARKFLAAVPVQVAMGNHEKGVLPPFQLASVDGADRPAVDSFASGNVFVVLVNTNQDFSPVSQQYQQLEQRLSSPEARAAVWRFVAFHHPPFAAGWGFCNGYDGDADVRESLVPLLTRHGVDVVFNGHVHGYERGTWEGVTYITTGGGGGALDHACTPWPHIVVSSYVHHILSVDVKGSNMVVTARALDGAVIDKFELNKGRG